MKTNIFFESVPKREDDYWKRPLDQTDSSIISSESSSFDENPSLDEKVPKLWIERWKTLPKKPGIAHQKFLQKHAIRALNTLNIEAIKWLKSKGLTHILPNHPHSLKHHDIEDVFLDRFFERGEFHEPGHSPHQLITNLSNIKPFYHQLRQIFQRPIVSSTDPERHWLQILLSHTPEEFSTHTKHVDWPTLFNQLLQKKSNPSIFSPDDPSIRYAHVHPIYVFLEHLHQHIPQIYQHYQQGLHQSLFEGTQPLLLHFEECIEPMLQANAISEYIQNANRVQKTLPEDFLAMIEQHASWMHQYKHQQKILQQQFYEERNLQKPTWQQQRELSGELTTYQAQHLKSWRPSSDLSQCLTATEPHQYNQILFYHLTKKISAHLFVECLQQRRLNESAATHPNTRLCMNQIYEHLQGQSSSAHPDLVQLYASYFSQDYNTAHHLLSKNSSFVQPFKETLVLIHQYFLDHFKMTRNMSKNSREYLKERIQFNSHLIDHIDGLKTQSKNHPDHLQAFLNSHYFLDCGYYGIELFHINKSTIQFYDIHHPDLLRLTGQGGQTLMGVFLTLHPYRETSAFALTPLLQLLEKHNLFNHGEPSVESLLSGQLNPQEQALLSRWTERHLKKILEDAPIHKGLPKKRRL